MLYHFIHVWRFMSHTAPHVRRSSKGQSFAQIVRPDFLAVRGFSWRFSGQGPGPIPHASSWVTCWWQYLGDTVPETVGGQLGAKIPCGIMWVSLASESLCDLIRCPIILLHLDDHRCCSRAVPLVLVRGKRPPAGTSLGYFLRPATNHIVCICLS